MDRPRLGWMTRAQLVAARVSFYAGLLLLLAGAFVALFSGVAYWLSGAVLLGVAAVIEHRAMSYHPEL